jgi:hypothetical protein
MSESAPAKEDVVVKGEPEQAQANEDTTPVEAEEPPAPASFTSTSSSAPPTEASPSPEQSESPIYKTSTFHPPDSEALPPPFRRAQSGSAQPGPPALVRTISSQFGSCSHLYPNRQPSVIMPHRYSGGGPVPNTWRAFVAIEERSHHHPRHRSLTNPSTVTPYPPRPLFTST